MNSMDHGTGPSIDGSVDAAGAVLNIHEDSLSLSCVYVIYICILSNQYYQINLKTKAPRFCQSICDDLAIFPQFPYLQEEKWTSASHLFPSTATTGKALAAMLAHHPGSWFKAVLA